MKKKVALLLALVMVMSLMPMNVFGNTVTFMGRVIPQNVESPGTYTYQLDIDMRNFAGRTPDPRAYGGVPAYIVELALAGVDGGLNWGLHFAHRNAGGLNEDNPSFERLAITTHAALGGANNLGDFEVIIVPGGLSDRTARLHIRYLGDPDGRLPNDAIGSLGISLNIAIGTDQFNDAVSAGSQATLTAIDRTAGIEGRVLIPTTVIMHFPGHGVTITANSVNFQNPAFLRPIVITENRIGALNMGGSTMITLTAPRDYVFNIELAGNRIHGGVYSPPTFAFGTEPFSVWSVRGPLAGSPVAGYAEIPSADITVNEHWHNNIYHRLTIHFPAQRNNSNPFANIPDALQIRGLVMVPLPGAPQRGPVNVHVAAGYLPAANSITNSAAQNPAFNWWLYRTQTEVGPLTFNAATGNFTSSQRTRSGVAENHPTGPNSDWGDLEPWNSGDADASNALPDSAFRLPAWSTMANEGWVTSTVGNRRLGTTNWNASVQVAYRTDVPLELRVVEDEVPTLVSGLRNVENRVSTAAGGGLPYAHVDWTGIQDVGQHNSAQLHENYRFLPHADNRTASIQLVELSAGALQTGLHNSVVEFTFDQPGVQLMAARWRITDRPDWESGSTDLRNWRRVEAPLQPLNPVIPLGQALTQPGVGVIHRGDHINHLNHNNFNNTFTLVIPRSTEAHRLRTLHVTFSVSIEAGYEWKYEDTDIVVTVSGNAAQALAEDNREAVVATVEDPIVVELMGDPLLVDVGNVFNLIAPTAIPDIVITETEVGRLRRGQEIFVGVTALPTAIIGHPVLSDSVITINEESGARISWVRTTFQEGAAGAADVVMPVASPAGNITGYRITITRDSVGTEPLVITLSNNHIMGAIMPGVRYAAFVSGPAHGNVNVAGTGNNWLTQNTWRAMHNIAGRFDSLGYYTDVVTFDSWAEGYGPGGGPGFGGFGRLMFTEDTMWDYNGTQIQAMIWREFVPGFNTAGISARVFTDIVGGESQWDAATNTATFRFTSIGGNDYEIALVVGQTNATINGQSVDIATRSAQPGLAGRVSPINEGGRIFVPARFLATIHGIAIEGDGHTLTIG